MRSLRSAHLALGLVAGAALLTLGGCASDTATTADAGSRHQDLTPAAVTEPTAAPGTIAYDRDVWVTLVSQHSKIRREMKPLANGVEATTESDDPAIAALIKNHAFAMQRRMRDGSRVRQWDPVFVKLFDYHTEVKLDVQATEKGVSIIETSDNPEVVRVLHSHAAGVTEMVKRGPDAARNETPFRE